MTSTLEKGFILGWVGILIFLCFYSAIPAIAAQLAIKYLLKFKPSFKHIYLLVLISLFASTFVDLVINFAISSGSQFKQDSIFIPILTFLLARFVLFAKYIKLPETGVIGERKSLKVVVVSTIIEILLTLPIGLIIVVLFNATR